MFLSRITSTSRRFLDIEEPQEVYQAVVVSDRVTSLLLLERAMPLTTATSRRHTEIGCAGNPA